MRILVFVMMLSASPLFAQGTKADYQRADELQATTVDKVIHGECEPHWIGDGKAFWYRSKIGPDAYRYVRVDAASGEKRDLFDPQLLANSLGKAADQKVRADHPPIESPSVSDDGETFRFSAFNARWEAKLETAEVKAIDAPPPERPRRNEYRRVGRRPDVPPPPRGAKSPDGKFEAFVRENNIYLRELQKDATTQLSFGGSAGDPFQDELAWSPDSSKLVALQERQGSTRQVTVVQSSPTDQTQPKVVTYPYAKAGDEFPQRRPRVFEMATKKLLPLDESLFPNPWSLEDLRWAADSKTFTFRYNQRGHLVLRVIEADATTGKTRAIVEEKSDSHIAYNDKYFCEPLDATGEIVWMSERSGWNHLYLYDAKTGTVKNAITTGEWPVRRVLRLDESTRQIWFVALGVKPGGDPLFQHVGRVNLDGSGLVWLTTADATHDVSFSPDYSKYVDTYSKVDQPPISELHNGEDGKLIAELEKADASKLYESGWKAPVPFIAPGRDGTTPVSGVLYIPRNLDPTRKYPVVEDIYMGLPIVPKKFARYDGRMAMAELGFVVVVIDPMVTIWPSRKHWDTGYKNLGDGGFPDRIKWIKAAAEKYPFMDLNRVGLFGTSAGGQAALRGVLAHGDFYKAAVASCGCHDNRMDKIWWNEYWMGWPVGPWYAEQSNVTHAHELKGKLLLMVGELDDNVDPASTMQVVNELIKADKDFEFVVLPNEKHTAGGNYGERRRRDFFVRALMGVEPRRE